MSFEEIKNLLIQKFSEEVVVGEETGGLQPALLIAPDRIADVCLELRDNPATYCDFLACLSAVDYGCTANQSGVVYKREEPDFAWQKGASSNRFGVVYNLTSIPYQTQLTLKVSREHTRDVNDLPVFPTVSTVYKTAEWHEREAFDLMGIFFEGNPDLRRILLPDDWEGYPLRKDYQAAEYYKGIKID